MIQPLVAWLRGVRPRRSDVAPDAVAGIPGAISSVPDGMATAVLAGVNPAFGLYAAFAGKIGGALSTSTSLMVVTTTTAASLAAGSALEGLTQEARDRSIVLLTVLTGVVIIGFGVLRLGRFVRFVSRSVMLGFLTGVAVNILLGQLPDLTGVTPPPGVAAAKAWYVITHPGEIVWLAAAIGGAALIILAVLGRTRFSLYGALVAVVVPSALVAWLGSGQIEIVDDVGQIPTGMPPLVLPQLSDLSVGLVIGALSIAAIVVVQGAGVAESAPNPDGSASSTNGDFLGQGVANVVSGLFHGTPVGGSVTATSLNITAGARSRWASVFAGLWMLLILLLLSELVAQVLMPTLAAVLIYAAARALKFLDMIEVWRTAHTGKVALLVTFIATLALPVAAAVAIGLVCSLLLQLNKEAMDLRVVRLVPTPDGRLAEHEAPKSFPDDGPLVLDIYGSLLYAGARTLGARLPDPHGVAHPILVLRLRGRTSLGSTFFGVVSGYAAMLAESGGRLYLSGVSPDMVDRFDGMRVTDHEETVHVFAATEVLGESTMAAMADARTWLVEQREHPPRAGSVL